MTSPQSRIYRWLNGTLQVSTVTAVKLHMVFAPRRSPLRGKTDKLVLVSTGQIGRPELIHYDRRFGIDPLNQNRKGPLPGPIMSTVRGRGAVAVLYLGVVAPMSK